LKGELFTNAADLWVKIHFQDESFYSKAYQPQIRPVTPLHGHTRTEKATRTQTYACQFVSSLLTKKYTILKNWIYLSLSLVLLQFSHSLNMCSKFLCLYVRTPLLSLVFFSRTNVRAQLLKCSRLNNLFNE